MGNSVEKMYWKSYGNIPEMFGKSSETISEIKQRLESHQATEVHHIVKIQDLERKEQPKPYKFIKEYKICKFRQGLKPADVSYFEETSTNEDRHSCPNNFIGAFLNAYNYHGDIMLTPDDIWIMISLYFSKYVDKNAEKLRNRFVRHDGKKELVVVEDAGSQESEWDNFFEQILHLINENTTEGVVEALSCNFTTTKRIHKVISTAIIMNSFKKYFSYGRAIMGCGIANVHFTGCRDDWLLVLAKTKNLHQYDVDGDGVLCKYLYKIVVILNQFIDTYDNKVDKSFWNRIMTTEEYQVGSGGQTQTEIEGWILHFFGIYDKVNLDRVPDYAISVNVRLDNMDTGTKKDLELCANFISVSNVDQYTYKPDLGIAIIPTKKENTKENYWD